MRKINMSELTVRTDKEFHIRNQLAECAKIIFSENERMPKLN